MHYFIHLKNCWSRFWCAKGLPNVVHILNASVLMLCQALHTSCLVASAGRYSKYYNFRTIMIFVNQEASLIICLRTEHMSCLGHLVRQRVKRIMHFNGCYFPLCMWLSRSAGVLGSFIESDAPGFGKTSRRSYKSV